MLLRRFCPRLVKNLSMGPTPICGAYCMPNDQYVSALSNCCCCSFLKWCPWFLIWGLILHRDCVHPCSTCAVGDHLFVWLTCYLRKNNKNQTQVIHGTSVENSSAEIKPLNFGTDIPRTLVIFSSISKKNPILASIEKCKIVLQEEKRRRRIRKDLVKARYLL